MADGVVAAAVWTTAGLDEPPLDDAPLENDAWFDDEPEPAATVTGEP